MINDSGCVQLYPILRQNYSGKNMGVLNTANTCLWLIDYTISQLRWEQFLPIWILSSLKSLPTVLYTRLFCSLLSEKNFEEALQKTKRKSELE